VGVKTYDFYCQVCGYHRTSDGSDVQDLVPVKQALLPGGVPFLDPVTRQTVVPKSFKRPKKFKCPRCGRVITARKVQPAAEGEAGVPPDEPAPSP
jgi:hypothetical protein